jgi:hypothetical protein
LTFSNVRPLADSTHSPLMKFLYTLGGAIGAFPFLSLVFGIAA